MYSFGEQSEKNLQGVDITLQLIVRKAILIMDFSVISGYRDQEEQEKLVRAGVSWLHYPDSKHNCKPARALDLAPHPLEWPSHKDTRSEYNRKWNRFQRLMGIIEGIASELGVKVKFGIDWNNPDGPHIELA